MLAFIFIVVIAAPIGVAATHFLHPGIFFGHVDQPNIFFKKQKKERNFRDSKKLRAI